MQQQLYFLFLFFCLSISTSLSAQESNTYILGKITDKISEEGVESALVFEKTEQIGVESDQFGFYQLSVPPNKPLTIIIRRVGYDQATIKLNAIQSGTVMKLDISLTQNNMGEGVVIYAESIGDKNMVRANVQEFKLLPTVSGNVESMLPSIALGTSSGSGGELTSQYNVRGGNYDENLVYVNDFEIFRPQLIRAGQQEGLSFPNIDLIRDLSFSSGGFEARYGDKLSSVLDVKYKRPEAFKGSISGSLLGATAHLEGSTKIKKNQTGRLRYLLGARYKTTRYILGSLDAKGEYFPNFLDLQSYITYDFHPNWQLALIGNLNSATYNFTPTETEIVTGGFFFPHKFSADFEGGEKDRFNNNMAGVALNFIPQKRKNPSFVKILASAYNGDESETFDILSYFKVSKLELDLKGGKPKEIGVLGDGIQHNYARNRLQNIILNSEIKAGIEIPRFNYDKDTESSHFLHGGIKWQQEHFKDRINEWIRTDSAGYSLPNAEDEYQLGTVIKSVNEILSTRLTAFGQETYTFKKIGRFEVQATIGARVGYWSLNDEWIISPRGQFLIRPLGKENQITYKLAGGIYQQQPFYREMRRPDGTLNTSIRSQKSSQIIGGITYEFEAGKKEPVRLKLIAEAYYKDLWDQISYNVDNVKVRYSGVNDSKAFARGIDFRINGEFVSGFESWLNISILETKEKILGVNHQDAFGKPVTWVPRPTSRFFTGSLYFQDYLPMNKNFKTHLQLNFGTGLPYGPPGENLIKRNALTYKAYQRVDIGFSFQMWDKSRIEENPKHFLRWTQRSYLSVEVFNLLDVQNVASVNWVKDFNNIYYYFPINLTSRRINLKLRFEI
jgi:hypothetical protein